MFRKNGIYESSRITYIKADTISPNPMQPRRIFDQGSLKELAASIDKYGIIQPLIVRRRGREYELIAGERRLRAAKMLDMSKVPCIVLEVDKSDSSVIALVENLHRRDLDFIEEAEGIYQLINTFGLSQEEAAKKLGKSQSAIANKLRILRLGGEMLYVIREAGLTERHARALLRLDDEQSRIMVLEKIINDGLNVTKTEEYIEMLLSGENEDEKQSAPRPIYVIKDVRLFLNTVSRGMTMMKQSGIRAEYGKSETDTDIILTIKIPKMA